MINVNNGNWRWKQIATWLLSGKYTTDSIMYGAEIGVKEGRFIDYMCNLFQHLTIHAVDPRCVQSNGAETYLDWDWDSINAEYYSRVDRYKERVIEHQTFSELASLAVPAKSLDFVFLDAQHDYKSVKRDILLWIPKIKEGGLICGHDYDPNPERNYGVIPAVNEFFKGKEIMKGSNFTWGVWL